MKKIITSALIAIISLASCKKDDTICYNNLTMGNIVDGNIVSDQGNTFDITGAPLDLSQETFKYGRVILLCDVLKKTAENRYDIRLTGIESVLAKEPLPTSVVTPDSEAAVNDPIFVRDIWYGGGYINMLIEFARKSGSQKKHLINLIHEDAATTEDGLKTYTFSLHHNAFEETPDNETVLDFEMYGGYVSFPVAGLIQEDEAKITINWSTHQVTNGNISWIETKEISKTYDWTRSGFEQAASKTARPSLKLQKSHWIR